MVDTCLRLEYGIVFRVLSNFSTRNCSLVLAVPVASRDGDTEEGDEWDKPQHGVEPLQHGYLDLLLVRAQQGLVLSCR